MPRYTFTFKKDDIYVEFTTENKEVVEKQFQKWVMHADEYVRNQVKRSSYGQTMNTVNNTVYPKQEPSFEPQSQQQPPQDTMPANTQQNTSSYTIPQSQSDPSQQLLQNDATFDTVSNLLKTINSAQEAYQSLQKQRAEQQSLINQQSPALQPQPQPQQNPAENASQGNNFESVLDEKMETNTYEPPQNVDQIFLNLINSKNTKDKFHYLMITAYYLTEFGKQERFTLKQVNTKLMQNVSEVIDHGLIQEAINQGFIELVPDPTGMAQVGEYRLTRQGEEFFAYRI